MRKFELTILGCGAAAPTPYFLTTSQLVNIHDHLILIDCGEGCQLTLRKLKLKFQRIKTILISHMHADHVMGLPGLLASMNLLGRKIPIDVFGPEDLEDFVKTIWHKTGTHIDFPISFNVVDATKQSVLLEMKSYKIQAFPTKHRIDTCGFRIDELRGNWSLKPEAKDLFNLTYSEINLLKKGDTVNRKGGVIITPAKCCIAPDKPRSYVFAADTAFTPKVIAAASDATLLYHEATFMEAEKQIAIKTKHSTASDAGRVAKQANVDNLMLGHFSNRYRHLEDLLSEAQAVFKKTFLAIEGDTVSIENLD